MRAPRRIWVGLGLVAASWVPNWSLDGLRTHLLFFPLWLGYILALDGLTCARSGTSPLARLGARGTAFLFAVSAPVWWLFELFNLRLANWEYVGRERFGDLEYFVLCSVSFSTVMPAVFVTAEWMRGMRWVERFGRGPAIRLGGTGLARLGLVGLAMLAAMLVWPRALYPLVWVGGVFLLEPIVVMLGRRGLSFSLAVGDWRGWLSLWAGGLFCGFFWELWNLYSYPKWIYHTPGVEFAYLFEMPALGYLGYLPFALELYLLLRLLAPRTSTVVTAALDAERAPA